MNENKRFILAYDNDWWAVRDGNIILLKEEVVNLLNRLNDENEQLKVHQKTLESKIVRLKDRVKTFEKHYSRKDIERYKKMENCNCITSERLKRYL